MPTASNCLIPAWRHAKTTQLQLVERGQGLWVVASRIDYCHSQQTQNANGIAINAGYEYGISGDALSSMLTQICGPPIINATDDSKPTLPYLIYDAQYAS
ncbi:MAG: hypothetical protein H7Y02_00575 [Candidatus Obscuribacterales bacterium]|nr:hypothetical protein [Steroidobacteraceae bacterium]